MNVEMRRNRYQLSGKNVLGKCCAPVFSPSSFAIEFDLRRRKDPMVLSCLGTDFESRSSGTVSASGLGTDFESRRSDTVSSPGLGTDFELRRSGTVSATYLGTDFELRCSGTVSAPDLGNDLESRRSSSPGGIERKYAAAIGPKVDTSE